MTKNDDRVTEWEEGLPSPEELTPLSQSLISPELASAFSITGEPVRTISDVHRASISTFATLRRTASVPIPGFNKLQASISAEDERGAGAAFVFGLDGQAGGNGVVGSGEVGNVPSVAGTAGLDQNVPPFPQPFQAQGTPAAGFPPATGQLGSSPGVLNGLPPYAVSSYERKPDGSPSAGGGFGGTDSSDGAVRRFKNQNEGEAEEADTGAAPENSNDEQAARTLKRPRLVWTPQLHKRFVDAVAHLGIKNAVPKTIMQLMNVEGLTRENVASHLQKYRLYLKRMQGFSNEGPSASDQLFASTPVPPSLAASAHFLAAHRDDGMLMPFTAPVVPVPLAGFGHGHIPGHMNSAGPFAGFDPHAYSALARTPPQRMVSGDQRELVGDNQSQPGSPPRHILTLFPTSSR